MCSNSPRNICTCSQSIDLFDVHIHIDWYAYIHIFCLWIDLSVHVQPINTDPFYRSSINIHYCWEKKKTKKNKTTLCVIFLHHFKSSTIWQAWICALCWSKAATWSQAKPPIDGDASVRLQKWFYLTVGVWDAGMKGRRGTQGNALPPSNNTIDMPIIINRWIVLFMCNLCLMKIHINQ